MNATEKNYLMKRIDDMKCDKVAKWRSGADETKVFKIRYDLIKSGKVRLVKGVNNTNSHAFSEFDFSKYPEAIGRPYYETPKELEKKVSMLKDEVMLGSSEEAMKMLKEFENWQLK